MFRKVFYKKSNDDTRRHRKQASTSYHVATASPDVSRDACAGADTGRCSDVSLLVLEPSVSGPILVSDESIADLAETFRKKCTCRSKPSSSKQHDTPTSCCVLKLVERSDKCEECNEGVQQLYFNVDAKKSDSSGPTGRCINEECIRRCEMRTVSSVMLTKVEKEVMNRSCDGTVKDSAGACSLADSASGSCDAARAQYYHNKLLSTLQILHNKEETISVQAESLALAEARIAALAARAADLRRELDRKTKELHSMENCKLDKTDVSVMAERQEADDPTDVVSMLQNNLCVIEDLYRECFYETAKQESLIDMLRASYLEARRADQLKAARIGRLQHAVHSRDCSLERCQDLAMEVDTLKTEISNFLNNSTNNDSGVWEARWEPAADAQVQLQEVMEQLLRLRGLLASGCICGLQEENMKLKQSNETMEVKIGELRHNMSELESELENKDRADARCKQEIETKEKELLEIRRQLAAVQEGSRDQSSACDTLAQELQQVQALLEEKTAELAQFQEQKNVQESTIKDLQQELERADQIIKENCKIRSEVSYLTSQVSLWRAQLADSERRVRALEAELLAARAHCTHIDACYREKASSVAALQAQLEQAHARGAALCGEARRAVAAVRRWARHTRDTHREQETLLKEKETMLAALQQRIEERQDDIQHASVSENEPTCSKCSSSRNENSRSGPRELPGGCPTKRSAYYGASGSEVASCSTAPVPPRRLLRKKLCGSQQCGCGSRDAGSQQPARREAGTSAGPRLAPDPVRVRLERTPRDVSPTEELCLRVQQMSAAWAQGPRRWARGRHVRGPPAPAPPSPGARADTVSTLGLTHLLGSPCDLTI